MADRERYVQLSEPSRCDLVLMPCLNLVIGTHPELIHLVQVIEHRRTARLELARRMLIQSEASITRQNGADLRSGWYDWARERSDLRKSMMDEAYIKKRKLEREKRSIERPRSGK